MNLEITFNEFSQLLYWTAWWLLNRNISSVWMWVWPGSQLTKVWMIGHCWKNVKTFLHNYHNYWWLQSLTNIVTLVIVKLMMQVQLSSGRAAEDLLKNGEAKEGELAMPITHAFFKPHYMLRLFWQNAKNPLLYFDRPFCSYIDISSLYSFVKKEVWEYKVLNFSLCTVWF